jgi:hypothetical protein
MDAQNIAWRKEKVYSTLILKENTALTTEDGTAQTGDIIPCGFNNGWLFCCGIGCCSGSNPATFYIGNATNVYEERLGTAVHNISTSSKASGSAASTAGASPTTASGSISGATASATIIPPNECATSGDSHTNIAYGAGLGVGLGIPLLLALALLYFEHTRRIRAEGQLTGLEGAKAGLSDAGYAQPYEEAKYEQATSQVPVNPTELQGASIAHELAVGQQHNGA